MKPPVNSGDKKSLHVRYLFLGLMTACYTLDAFDVWGRVNSPHVLAKFACSIQPYTMLVSPIISSGLVSYASDQCHGQPQEPTYSIIFLMLKMILACVAS